MTHDELVFGALAYRRNVGATIDDIRSYLQCREEKKHTQKHDRAALRRLPWYSCVNDPDATTRFGLSRISTMG